MSFLIDLDNFKNRNSHVISIFQLQFEECIKHNELNIPYYDLNDIKFMSNDFKLNKLKKSVEQITFDFLYNDLFNQYIIKLKSHNKRKNTMKTYKHIFNRDEKKSFALLVFLTICLTKKDFTDMTKNELFELFNVYFYDKEENKKFNGFLPISDKYSCTTCHEDQPLFLNILNDYIFLKNEQCLYPDGLPETETELKSGSNKILFLLNFQKTFIDQYIKIDRTRFIPLKTIHNDSVEGAFVESIRFFLPEYDIKKAELSFKYKKYNIGHYIVHSQEDVFIENNDSFFELKYKKDISHEKSNLFFKDSPVNKFNDITVIDKEYLIEICNTYGIDYNIFNFIECSSEKKIHKVLMKYESSNISFKVVK